MCVYMLEHVYKHRGQRTALGVTAQVLCTLTFEIASVWNWSGTGLELASRLGLLASGSQGSTSLPLALGSQVYAMTPGACGLNRAR